MDVYVITVGCYEDQHLVGVALTPDEAADTIVRAKLSGEFRNIETFGGGPSPEDTYTIHGPYKPGAIPGECADLIDI